MNFSRKSGVFCAAAAAALLAIAFAGCTVGPKYNKPAAITPASPNYRGATTDLTEQPGWKVASPNDQMLRGKWWEIFQEPELNALEDQLNIDNQSVKFYFENYLAARAIIREARSQYYPTVTVGAGYSRTRSSASLAGGAVTGGSGSSSEIGRAHV